MMLLFHQVGRREADSFGKHVVDRKNYAIVSKKHCRVSSCIEQSSCGLVSLSEGFPGRGVRYRIAALRSSLSSSTLAFSSVRKRMRLFFSNLSASDCAFKCCMYLPVEHKNGGKEKDCGCYSDMERITSYAYLPETGRSSARIVGR